MTYRGKRALDVTGAAAALVLTSPLLAMIALAVRLGSPGPVLHRATRVGVGGTPYTLYKFRSMVVGAAGAGTAVTAGGDPRITSVGRIIRRWKLDELPQLWNVLRGDMSLVGPRPEDPRYVEHYTDNQRRILQWRPGITSPASVAFRHEEQLLAGAEDLDLAYHRLMVEKLECDLRYFPTQSLRGDLRILWSTLTAVAT